MMSPAKIDNRFLATSAEIPIPTRALGLLVKDINVNVKRPARIKRKIEHPIPNFLKEKLFFAHSFTSVDLLT